MQKAFNLQDSFLNQARKTAVPLTVFLVNGTPWVALGVTAGLFNMAGAWLGSCFFMGKGVRVVRPVMLLVLAIFFIKVLLELLGVA